MLFNNNKSAWESPGGEYGIARHDLDDVRVKNKNLDCGCFCCNRGSLKEGQ
jgi:hypothetical protein